MKSAGLNKPETNQPKPPDITCINPGDHNGSIAEGPGKKKESLAVELLRMTLGADEDHFPSIMLDALHKALLSHEQSDLPESLQHLVELVVIGAFQEYRIRASISAIARPSVQSSQISSDILKSFFESSKVVSTLTQFIGKYCEHDVRKGSTDNERTTGYVCQRNCKER